MRIFLLSASVATVAAATLSLGPASAVDAPTVDKRATLSAIDLASVQTSIANDRGVDLGGIGSGLFALGHNQYWTVTDRGPNGDVDKNYTGTPAAAGDKSFILPEFTPHLVKIRARGTSLEVLQRIPITTQSNNPATGLPNYAQDPGLEPWLSDWDTRAGYNPNGLDTEGVVQAADGSFWVVDEYGPSIVHIGADGRVIARHVPEGKSANYFNVDPTTGAPSATPDAGELSAEYPIVDNLPEEFASRKGNRGFEDIALLPNGTFVVALQSPLTTDATGLVTRLLVFDPATGDDIANHTYQFLPTSGTNWPAGTKKGDLKISALVPIDNTHVLVEERTDDVARFYKVTLPAASGAITDKTLVAKLDGVAGVPGKVEGAALKSKDTLVIISDNDFGFDVTQRYPLGGDVASSGIPTVLAEIKLP